MTAWPAVATVSFILLACILLSVRHMIRRRSLRNYWGSSWHASEGSASFVSTTMTRSEFLTLMGDMHRQQVQILPRYTASGCLCAKVPPTLKQGLVREYLRKRAGSHTSPETDAALVEFQSESARPGMTWITGSDAEAALRSWLSAALATWCGLPRLDHTATYGVRTYKQGSRLTPHTDRYLTHAISAIIHIEKKLVTTDWPLEVLPHEASHVHQVFLTDDLDCLFYESATVPHGRLQPLEGEEYSNLFVHFSPPGWSSKAEKLMNQ